MERKNWTWSSPYQIWQDYTSSIFLQRRPHHYLQTPVNAMAALIVLEIFMCIFTDHVSHCLFSINIEFHKKLIMPICQDQTKDTQQATIDGIQLQSVGTGPNPAAPLPPTAR